MKILKAAYDSLATRRMSSADAASAAILYDYGNGWLEVDIYHAAYPRRLSVEMPTGTDGPVAPTPPKKPTGPGTHLKVILRRFGIKASPTCGCNAMALNMNEWGPDGCESRLSEILFFLETQAKSRRLPFVRFLAEKVVKLAIRRARNSAAQ